MSTKDYASYGIISVDDQRHLAALVRTIRSAIDRKVSHRVKKISTVESETDQRDINQDKRFPFSTKSNVTALNDPVFGVAAQCCSPTVVKDRDGALGDIKLQSASSYRRPGWYDNTDHVTAGSSGEMSSATGRRSPVKLRRTVETRVVTSPASVDVVDGSTRGSRRWSAVDIKLSSGSDNTSTPGCYKSQIASPEKFIRNAGEDDGGVPNNGDGEGLSAPEHHYSSSMASVNIIKNRATYSGQPEKPMRRGAANWNTTPTDTDDNVGGRSGVLHTNISSTSSVKRLQKRDDVTESDHPTRIETVWDLTYLLCI